jgi:hypothetical protein
MYRMHRFKNTDTVQQWLLLNKFEKLGITKPN